MTNLAKWRSTEGLQTLWTGWTWETVINGHRIPIGDKSCLNAVCQFFCFQYRQGHHHQRRFESRKRCSWTMMESKTKSIIVKKRVLRKYPNRDKITGTSSIKRSVAYRHGYFTHTNGYNTSVFWSWWFIPGRQGCRSVGRSFFSLAQGRKGSQPVTHSHASNYTTDHWIDVCYVYLIRFLWLLHHSNDY